MTGLLIFGILLVCVLWPCCEEKSTASREMRKKIVVVGFCLILTTAGAGRHRQAELKITNNELRNYINIQQDIILTGIISREPDVRENNIQLTIQAREININENDSRNIRGKVLVTASRYPEYQYGDELKIKGRIDIPPHIPDFNYTGYLSKEGIYFVMSYPTIDIAGNDRGVFVYAKILALKNKIKSNILQIFSPPQSDVLSAMILGDKNKMPEDFKEKLNIVGLRHITAISGMHITIISVLLMNFLIGLGLWRRQAFYSTLAILFLFIIMIGFPASAVRAGIMGGLLLLAQNMGRLNKASRAIIFACALMLLANPLLLKFDVGFQLSFLAAMGIIFLSSFLQKWLTFIPDSFIRLRSIVVMTLSAQIFTLPVLIYNFGRISTISPLANVLVVPLMPIVLGLGFLVSFLSVLWLPLGKISSFLLWPFIAYIVKIVEWLSRVRWASVAWENMSVCWLAIFYLVLTFLIWLLNKRQRLKLLY